MEHYPWKILRYGSTKVEKCTLFRNRKIDVLEARDYVDRVPDVIFVIRQRDVDFRVFYGNYKIVT